jgi:hypothetical protein
MAGTSSIIFYLPEKYEHKMGCNLFTSNGITLIGGQFQWFSMAFDTGVFAR